MRIARDDLIICMRFVFVVQSNTPKTSHPVFYMLHFPQRVTILAKCTRCGYSPSFADSDFSLSSDSVRNSVGDKPVSSLKLR